jgi:hypothetical protein
MTLVFSVVKNSIGVDKTNLRAISFTGNIL